MTVAELIAKLQKMPAELEVYVQGNNLDFSQATKLNEVEILPYGPRDAPVCILD